jgi:hypothetical protein
VGRREDLLTAAHTSGGDPAALLVCADWLEEHGEVSLAYAYRWCARRGHFPLVTPTRKLAAWAARPAYRRRPGTLRFELPRPVWDALRPRKGPGASYRCRDAGLAFAALADALRRLREALALDPP